MDDTIKIDVVNDATVQDVKMEKLKKKHRLRKFIKSHLLKKEVKKASQKVVKIDEHEMMERESLLFSLDK